MTREADDYENEIADLQNRLDIAEYDKERFREEVTALEKKIKALSVEPCEDTISFPKGTLKKRGKGYVVYNPEWLKENWQTELKVMGVECEDAISRQAVLTYIEFILTHGMGKKMSFEFIKKFVEKLPSVTPKPKMGRFEWVHYDDFLSLGDWVCSECKSAAVECVRKDYMGGIPIYKYCPNCGAKMDELQESEGAG